MMRHIRVVLSLNVHMKLLNPLSICTLRSPSNVPFYPLAVEHHFYDQVNEDSPCRIVVWESPVYMAVLGHGNSLAAEVRESECRRDNVHIYRRISGGGTVLQGPGCLNYCYLFPIGATPEIETISKATQYFLKLTQQVLLKSGIKSEIQGTSDLTIGSNKFSGNAQKRSRSAVMFHGTILYNFDLHRLPQYLALPVRQPEYRNHRDHTTFVTNIPVSPDRFVNNLSNLWGCDITEASISDSVISEYGRHYYENMKWNRKF